MGSPALLAFRDELERLRLESLEHLLQARDAVVVALERAPVSHRVRARPGGEADEGPGPLDVAQEPRRVAQPLAVAPLSPLGPAPHELLLLTRLDPPGRVRVGGRHGDLLEGAGALGRC